MGPVIRLLIYLVLFSTTSYPVPAEIVNKREENSKLRLKYLNFNSQGKNSWIFACGTLLLHEKTINLLVGF